MWVLLQAFWKPLAIILVIGLALAYVKVLHVEIAHYKDSSAKWEQQYVEYKNNSEAIQSALKSSNGALTLQLKQQQVQQNQAQETFKKALNLKVANDEASKHIVVPASTISVFNSSATDPNASPGQSARSEEHT